jgi:hypothetical protein
VCGRPAAWGVQPCRHHLPATLAMQVMDMVQELGLGLGHPSVASWGGRCSICSCQRCGQASRAGCLWPRVAVPGSRQQLHTCLPSACSRGSLCGQSVQHACPHLAPCLPPVRPVKERLVAMNGQLVTVREQAGEAPNGTAFTITTQAAPELDRTNLVVGRVVEGMDVVTRITQVQCWCCCWCCCWGCCCCWGGWGWHCYCCCFPGA